MQKNIRYFTIFLQKHKTKWQDLCIFVAERGKGGRVEGWKGRRVERLRGGKVEREKGKDKRGRER
ncbi:MAG: hypothetical protein EAZ95_19655 [Bacteroidetes bacterium]|nr:MAG: hypothetical protein EAZ95_19655 [Bacteroidota bacterium]